jgi:hypothetical protein
VQTSRRIFSGLHVELRRFYELVFLLRTPELQFVFSKRERERLRLARLQGNALESRLRHLAVEKTPVNLFDVVQPKDRADLTSNNGFVRLLFAESGMMMPDGSLSWPIFSSKVICSRRASAFCLPSLLNGRSWLLAKGRTNDDSETDRRMNV